MIHFKNHKGFGTLEVLCAVAVAAMVLGPLLVLQGTILKRVSSGTERLCRLIYAKDFLYEVRREQPVDIQTFSQKKQEADPQGSFIYTLQPVAKQSSLASFEGLKFESVQYTWEWAGSYADSLVTFVYKAKDN